MRRRGRLDRIMRSRLNQEIKRRTGSPAIPPARQVDATWSARWRRRRARQLAAPDPLPVHQLCDHAGFFLLGSTFSSPARVPPNLSAPLASGAPGSLCVPVSCSSSVWRTVFSVCGCFIEPSGLLSYKRLSSDWVGNSRSVQSPGRVNGWSAGEAKRLVAGFHQDHGRSKRSPSLGPTGLAAKPAQRRASRQRETRAPQTTPGLPMEPNQRCAAHGMSLTLPRTGNRGDKPSVAGVGRVPAITFAGA